MPIELLAPAGSPEALDAAIGEGADAVYLGLKNFNARMRSVNFTYSQFEAALRSLRRMGKKCYVTVNTVFEQREADRVYQLLKYLSAAGPDALIVQDFGVLAMARSEFPKLKLHASTQMNIASGRGANALSRHGVSRVILSRELSLDELKSIRSETNMELEIFVHGALCVSASGLCLFSSYLGGKSANRGMCTQACRRLYRRGISTSNDEDIPGKGGEQDESGYFFSPADLQLLDHLPGLATAGINAFKIEGRMKSADYVGTVVSAYRLVLDAIDSGSEENIRQCVEKGKNILHNDFARSKTKFYFDANEARETVDWLNAAQDGGTGISLGQIQKTQGKGESRRGLVFRDACAGGKAAHISAAEILPAVGDTIRLHRSDDSERVSHKLNYAAAAAAGEASTEGCFWLSIPDGFGKGDRVYLIQTRAMSRRRYRQIITRDGVKGSRSPGFEKAPPPHIAPPQKKETAPKSKKKDKNAVFPEGIYAAVSNINDLYIVQSSRPARVMLNLTRKTAEYLLGESRPPLPFRNTEIIIVLDPYFPQAAAAQLSADIEQLVDLGYRQFVVNNPGHFSLFRSFRPKIQIIAGPWLYMFNGWALSFIASTGVDSFISPFENNRQNLERTWPRTSGISRSSVFVPVFAWPTLFRIRTDLSAAYDFSTFSDSRKENFSLIAGPDGSTVIPEKPFAITDKIPFLKEAGFRRFIIDLNGPPLKKKDYKDLMCAAADGTPLPNISRFNWKDGFWNGDKDRGPGTGD